MLSSLVSMLLVIVVIAAVLVIFTVIALVGVRVLLVPPHLPVLVSIVVRAGPGARGSASGDGVAGDRDGGLREGVTVERSPGKGYRRPCEDRPDELRIRHRDGFGDPPEHAVARRRRARPRAPRESGARQSASLQRPDLEHPEPVCRPVERQDAAGRGR